MTTKHTPGPWTVRPQFTDGAEVRGIASVAWCGRALSMAQGREHSVDFEEACANAHLIAAAPDLLAALEDMLGHCRTCDGKGRCWGPVPGRLGSYASDQPCQDCGDARAAIAKAKGETK